MPQTILNKTRLLMKGKFSLLDQADCYWQGLYVEKNEELALELYREAHRLREVGASFKLANFYRQKNRLEEAAIYYGEAYAEGASYETKRALEAMITNGAPAAVRIQLAIIFEKEQEWTLAFEQYNKVLELGDVSALYYLGNLLLEGRKELRDGEWIVTIPKNLIEAFQYLKQAAALGEPKALQTLEAAASTNPSAALFVAQIYELTSKQSAVKALAMYEQASQLGSEEASFRLAKAYELGGIVGARDLAKAVDYYCLSVRQEHKGALDNLIACVDASENAELEFKLGEFYHAHLLDNISALTWYKHSADRGNLIALNRIKEIANSDAAFAYAAAGLYAQNSEDQQSKQLLFFLYALAARQGHPQAMQQLNMSIESGDVEAQYAMAFHFYHYRAQHKEAVNLCLSAAEKKHSEALKYLIYTYFNEEIYLLIARCYESGNSVKIDINRAIMFYKKAAQVGSHDAAFRLGQIYETGINGVEINKITAFEYYLLAAEKGNRAASEVLENLVVVLDQAESKVKLAKFYFDCKQDKLRALAWYKKAADQGSASALMAIDALVMEDANVAYQAARLYEADLKNQQAYNYYLVAICHNHPEARAYIESLIIAGNTEAQYRMACNYHHPLGETTRAIELCLLAAEQGHREAKQYLKESVFAVEIYLWLARVYELGEGVVRNYEEAINFYLKACHAGDKSKLKNVANLYLKIYDQTDQIEYLNQACLYYIEAVKEGYVSALKFLNPLLPVANKTIQQAVMALYQLSQVRYELGEAEARVKARAISKLFGENSTERVSISNSRTHLFAVDSVDSSEQEEIEMQDNRTEFSRR